MAAWRMGAASGSGVGKRHISDMGGHHFGEEENGIKMAGGQNSERIGKYQTAGKRYEENISSKETTRQEEMKEKKARVAGEE